MRWLYTLLLYLVMPLVMLHLLWRGLRDSAYLKRWPERFGFFDPPGRTGAIVIHAASVGEVNVASALVKSLSRRFPELPVCLTTFTPTGSDRVKDLFRNDVFHVYAPLDLPGAVKRFYNRVQPSLTAAALDQVSRIAAKSQVDAERLIDIGADKQRIEVTGNLKFDVTLPPSLLEQGETIRMAWGADRLVLLAGSTHEGDEGPVLKAFSSLLKQFPQALLVLVPRHPERFIRVAQAARAAGFKVSLRSEGISCPSSTQCFVIDAMGELLQFYAACDVAFVGGSLDRIGGHNVLEPAALSRPVLVGPHTFNFEGITEQLVAAGAAVRVANAMELEEAVARLFSRPELRDQMGLTGLSLVKSGQGALQRTLELVEELITPTTG